MKNVQVKEKGNIRINNSYEAKPLETTLKEMMLTKEPIKADSPQIFTDRKDGIIDAYDIRTDRWDVALDAMDKVTKAHVARRDAFPRKTESEEEVGKASRVKETQN